MRVLFLGDIVGRPGRRAVREILPTLKDKFLPDLVVANGENAAGGNGITKEIADELYSAGIDILTMGNHVWDRKDIYGFIDSDSRLIRPANYPPGTPGRGFTIISIKEDIKVGVINLSGRVFLSPLECPFRTFDQIIPLIHRETKIVIVDFHAEATSEKVAFGWYVDGRATAVIGTHTHIQTADERILPNGTGYITDVGMTGPRNSVLGVKTELVLTKFLSLRPVRFEVAESDGLMMLNGLLLNVDISRGVTQEIKRIQVIKE